jgi:periplasmic glucans biosynthesis protein
MPPNQSTPWGAALAVALMVLAPAATTSAVERIVIDHDFVRRLAAEKAAKPHAEPRTDLPEFFARMNYDDYRRIRFVPEQGLWAAENLPFQVHFFHPGYLYQRTVRLHEFTGTHAQAIPFNAKSFDYQNLNVPLFSRWGLNYAGFRVLHPLNHPAKWDELISFLGASYFRALGRGQLYGISARGLSVNAGGPGREEFPVFTEFWLGKPSADASEIVVHALMESASLTGAYTFTVQPGGTTVVEVRATLFFRRATPLVGLAPMSSMFWFGEGSSSRFGDFRPEVHDSDGLLIAIDAQTRWWRPLNNPATLALSDFETSTLAGFGLLQRDRDFRNYEDFEARYERRPSLWVEPIGDWPRGRVRLIEIPARDEYHDNIAVFWTPSEPFPAGEPVELAWRLRWTFAPTFGGPPGWVRATRQTYDYGRPGRTKFVIDFDHVSLAAIPREATLAPEIELLGPGRLEHQQVFFNEIDGSRRLILVLASEPGARPLEVRARLLHEERPVTETWVSQWMP